MIRFAALLSLVAAGSACAADLPRRAVAPLAPEASTACRETEKSALSPDAFGFSTGSDVSDVGAWGISAEYNGAYKGAGFKPGRFATHLGKVQVATAFLPCFEVGPYLVGARSEGATTGLPGTLGFTAGGFGVETKYKLFGRATHGFGLTLDIDPSIQRFRQTDSTVSPKLGYDGTQAAVSYKILADTELVAGRLWAGLNIQFDQAWTERPAIANPVGSGDYLRGSALTISTALLAATPLDGLSLGAELRYLRSYNGLFLNQFTGDALYLGPTLLWQVSKSATISGTWAAQVAGSAKFSAGTAVPANLAASNLNLVTANQHLAKLKLSIGF